MNKALLFVTLMVAFLAMFSQAERPAHFNPLLKFKCMKQTTEAACVATTGCAFVDNKCRVAKKRAYRPKPRSHKKPVVDAESLLQLNEAAQDSLTGCITVCKTVKGINICGQYCNLTAEEIVEESLSEQFEEAIIEESNLQGCITVTKNGMRVKYCTLSDSLQAAELAENVDELHLEESNLQGCITVCKRGTCATYCTLSEEAEEAPAQLQGFGKSMKKIAKKAGRAARNVDWEIVV